MKKLLLALLFILPLRALCSPTDSLMVVMKTSKPYVKLKLTTNTAIVINWDDANKPDTVVLSGIVTHQYPKVEYSKEHTIKLYGNPADLIDFVCFNCDLTHLDVLNSTNLRILDCSFNELKSIDISKNTKLERLYCQRNRLKSLCISKNGVLNVLNCTHNELMYIDLSNNVNLRMVDCAYNDLTDLDVSNNTNLQLIDCGNNKLEYLNVSKNICLWMLFCKDNPFVTNKTAFVNLAQSLPDLTNNPNEGALIIGNSVSAEWIQHICNVKNWKIED